MKTNIPLIALVAALMTAASADDGPAAKPVAGEPAYTAVRNDVLEALNASDLQLPKCEAALARAGDELTTAQTNIHELAAAARGLEAQRRDLEAHVMRLEAIIQRYDDYTRTLVEVGDQTAPTTGDQLLAGWEQVDGTVGLALGWAVGTGQCVGLAYVFNQPAFGGGP